MASLGRITVHCFLSTCLKKTRILEVYSLLGSVSGHDLEKSAIIGHLEGFKTFLTQALNDAGGEDKIWIPCYRAFSHGRDVAEFYSRCAGKGMTVTVVRSDNYIFGGYTEKDWGSSLG